MVENQNGKLMTSKNMKSIKDKVAQEKGYPSWDEMYDWICRDGERPEVVGQLIEAACMQCFIEMIDDTQYELLKDYQPGSQIGIAYKQGVEQTCGEIKKLL